ncbi:hypothetical protein AB0H71_33620 [Nocardia sp. NPDC050697]|uniref:hypothetical protein n=1 Tax=Nocardia sp. NPDC050697 TaxID=3155158 RepID=UPI0033E8ACDF
MALYTDRLWLVAVLGVLVLGNGAVYLVAAVRLFRLHRGAEVSGHCSVPAGLASRSTGSTQFSTRIGGAE